MGAKDQQLDDRQVDQSVTALHHQQTLFTAAAARLSFRYSHRICAIPFIVALSLSLSAARRINQTAAVDGLFGADASDGANGQGTGGRAGRGPASLWRDARPPGGETRGRTGCGTYLLLQLAHLPASRKDSTDCLYMRCAAHVPDLLWAAAVVAPAGRDRLASASTRMPPPC